MNVFFFFIASTVVGVSLRKYLSITLQNKQYTVIPCKFCLINLPKTKFVDKFTYFGYPGKFCRLLYMTSTAGGMVAKMSEEFFNPSTTSMLLSNGTSSSPTRSVMNSSVECLSVSEHFSSEARAVCELVFFFLGFGVFSFFVRISCTDQSISQSHGSSLYLT